MFFFKQWEWHSYAFPLETTTAPYTSNVQQVVDGVSCRVQAQVHGADFRPARVKVSGTYYQWSNYSIIYEGAVKYGER